MNSGSINIGNAELKNLRLEDLRQNIGFVSQDPFLFDASIKENLLLADRSKGDSDLEKALHAACALDFVRKLPDHWNTVIGERGIRLSMGEKQRLTLARAILKSPSIIVLDEATSSVDVETERCIQEGLSNLIKKRTTLIIAHRLSTIREADQIVFLEKGKIVEQGRHESLIEKGGKYSSFYDYQENLITLE